MSGKNRKELKQNELAGALTGNLEKIKPHLPKIIIGFVALAGIVFAINYYFSTRNSAKEAKSRNMILFVVENSAAASLATLDKQIDDYKSDDSAGWAYLLKADRQLQQGNSTIFSDREAGLESLRLASENFEKAIDKAGKNKDLLIRAEFGLARTLESSGNFDAAAEKYTAISTEHADTAFATLATSGLNRVNDKSIRKVYLTFTKMKNNSLVTELDPLGGAPESNLGLPIRPDFTYPGEEPVLDIGGGDFQIPGTGDSKSNGKSDTPKSKGNEDAPPAPGDDVLGKGKSEKKTDEDSKNSPKTKSTEKKKQPVDEKKKGDDKNDAKVKPDNGNSTLEKTKVESKQSEPKTNSTSPSDPSKTEQKSDPKK